jgi:ubiquinone/menaquinone biosynthesis C-methylase UbiE
MAILDNRAWLIGLEGVALLRAVAGDRQLDEAFIDQRLAEVAQILAARDDRELAGRTHPQQTDVHTAYQLWAPTYDTDPNPLLDIEQGAVWPLLDRFPPGRAVDAGCGTGRHAGFLAARGHAVIGVDTAPAMLQAARRNVPDARFLLGDLSALPLAHQTADLVVCALALVHQPTLGPAFQEFARVLRPGGQLVVSDIHVASLYLGGIVRIVAPDGRLLVAPTTRLLASDYLRAARAAGFAVLDCVEPRWGAIPGEGGPLAQAWCPAAAAAAYRDTPAAIVWQFQRPTIASHHPAHEVRTSTSTQRPDASP